MNRRISACLTLAALTALSACSGSLSVKSPLFERLDDRGPVLLSADNPYLPAMRLMAEESERSPELRNFVARHGQPLAVEVRSSLASATELFLYYPLQKALYPFRFSSGTWLSGPPQEIPDDALGALEREAQQSGLQLADLSNGARSSKDSGGADETARARLEASVPLPEVARLRRTKAGDYLHTVTFPGESLSTIARWFTGGLSAVQKIARASKIRIIDDLKIGQEVTIPKTIVKNRRPLPGKEVRRNRPAVTPH